MSLLQPPSDCCCTPHMWNNANITSPHDSIKLKEVWGYPECNYFSTTQESLHERAKRCPSRTLWATVFKNNSIVSQCEFWFYFGTSGKSFKMAKEIRPPGKSSHLWTWHFEPEGSSELVTSSQMWLEIQQFCRSLQAVSKSWWQNLMKSPCRFIHAALMKLIKPTQPWSLFQVSDVKPVSWFHIWTYNRTSQLRVHENQRLKCTCELGGLVTVGSATMSGHCALVASD